MVGGEVIGIARSPDGTTLLHVAAIHYKEDASGKRNIRVVDDRETLSVRCKDGDHQVEVGDGVWWQCGKVYWTPMSSSGKIDAVCHVDYDIPLEKIGYSH